MQWEFAGHKKEVVHLRSCRKRSHFLISLSKESEMRLWDVPNETCLAKVSTEANCLVRSSFKYLQIKLHVPCIMRSQLRCWIHHCGTSGKFFALLWLVYPVFWAHYNALLRIICLLEWQGKQGILPMILRLAQLERSWDATIKHFLGNAGVCRFCNKRMRNSKLCKSISYNDYPVLSRLVKRHFQGTLWQAT